MQDTQNIIIDPEFRDLLPPLDGDTYKSLEENIIANGCMFPLVLWNSILIDGHNRYAICTEHDIAYKTVEKEFASREDVIIWIISNQVARRNLTPMQLTYFRGLHYNTVKGKGGNPQGVNQYSEVDSYFTSQPQKPSTAEQLSKHYKVHTDTIYKDAKTSKAIDAIGIASPEAKAKILSGDISIDKKELQKLAAASEEEINKAAVDILNGTYRKSETKEPAERGMPTVSPVNAQVDRAYKDYVSAAGRGSSVQIRRALRTFIVELEALYAVV